MNMLGCNLFWMITFKKSGIKFGHEFNAELNGGPFHSQNSLETQFGPTVTSHQIPGATHLMWLWWKCCYWIVTGWFFRGFFPIKSQLVDDFVSDELQILNASFPSSPLCCHLIWAKKIQQNCTSLPPVWIRMDLCLAFNHLLASRSPHVCEETCLDIGLAQRVSPMHARIVFM